MYLQKWNLAFFLAFNFPFKEAEARFQIIKSGVVMMLQ